MISLANFREILYFKLQLNDSCRLLFSPLGQLISILLKLMNCLVV